VIVGNHSKLTLFAVLALALASSASAGAGYKVLHAFDSSKHDGGGLHGSLALDLEGNLYGMTSGGGAYGDGTIFELTPQTGGHWTETILRSLNCNEKEGCIPQVGLALDATGNLYGMTTTGGAEFGSVFELKPGSQGWDLDVLHDRGGRGATLVLNKTGDLYGPMDGKGNYWRGRH